MAEDKAAAAAAPGKPPQSLSPQAGPKPLRGPREDMVFVWPHLVSIEAIASLIIILSLSLMSAFVNAPLMDLADAAHTPDPSKAPWYFLGLQELLLHMHPALAGVIVPGAALVLLGVIPYMDRERRGTAIWFNGPKGVRIALLAAVYTTIWELTLVFVDEWLPVPGRQGAHGIKSMLTYNLGMPLWVGDILVPTIFMILIPWVLVEIIKRRYNASLREVMVGLYSFFLTSFVVLTIIGTAFRGQSMKLMWPWDILPPH